MYSAFDVKNGRYLSTGRNSKSYGECIEAVKFVLALQYNEDLEDLPDNKLLEIFSVRIDKHINRTDNGTGELLADVIASYDNLSISARRGIRR
jgi:hypothetical protein